MGALDVVLPWRAANKIYAVPRVPGAAKSAFDRLGFWRAASGLLTVFLVSLHFGKGPYSTLVEDGGADLIVNGCFALAAMVLGVVGIHVITGGVARRTLRAGTVRMLRNIALVVLTVIVPVMAVPSVRTIYPDYPLSFPLLFLVCGPLVCTVFIRLGTRRSGRSTGRFLLYFQLAVVAGLLALSTTGLKKDDLGAVLLVVLVGLPVSVWWVAYLFFLLYWMARTVMWVGGVHRMLAPIGAVLIVLTAFVNKLLYYRADEVPYVWWLIMTSTGVVTTCALAVAEIASLRKAGLYLTGGAEPLPSEPAFARPMPPSYPGF